MNSFTIQLIHIVIIVQTQGSCKSNESGLSTTFMHFVLYQMQSELARPIPRKSVKSDHGCTSRIYFDNAGDNVTLTLYSVILTSQKPC